MSLWFNIRTDLYQASVTCWLTSWAQCSVDGQKGEELKVQRPPSCGISHSGIDLGFGGGVTQECETSQGCVSCAFHCGEVSSARTEALSMCPCLRPAGWRWCLTHFLNWRCKWVRLKCSETGIRLELKMSFLLDLLHRLNDVCGIL